MIPERLTALREEMKRRSIDIYVVPTADFHESEYVGEHFKARKFITGFTGSAGTAVITLKEAGLWTDGRYFVQAEKQLEGSTVTLYRMAEEGVPTVEEFVKDKLPQGGCIGFDGRTVNGAWGEKFVAIAEEKKGSLFVGEDLINLIWTDRPELSKAPLFILEEKYSGKSTAEKIKDVRAKMAEEGADVHILTSLCDIAWLLNIRGGDIQSVPVVLSYLVLTRDQCIWFLQEEVVDDTIRAYLKENHIETRPYDDIYTYVPTIPESAVVLMNKSSVNYRICSELNKNIQVINKPNPTELMKAVKNPVEVDNTRLAHVKDGVAVTKFMYWLKTNIGKIEITELSAAAKLETLRKEQEGYLWQSFEPICASAEHAAIVHYEPTPETDVPLTQNGLFLTDTGGGYLEGSTDISRTFAFGELTQQMKEDFTTVLQCNFNLAHAVFLEGTTGYNLDVLARMPAWRRGINFNHGTGHDVGYLMNIHEASCGFRCAIREKEQAPLMAGLVITDEPGIYIEGSHGVRTENELLVRKGPKNEYGQFLYFEPITYVPIDLDAIIPEMLTDQEREQLNEYHKKVYEIVAPHLNDEEREWLKEYTRDI